MLEKMCDFFTDNKSNAILGLDSNSHSVLFGGPETDPRGEDFEHFILGNDMYILNVGHAPTYQSSRYSSIIDISLCMGQILQNISS